MERNLTTAFLVVLMVIVETRGRQAVVPRVVNASLNHLYEDTVDSGTILIFQFDQNLLRQSVNCSGQALRVFSSSWDAGDQLPLMIVVTQSRNVMSWKVPFLMSGQHFHSVNHTLCPSDCFDAYRSDANESESVVYVSVSTSSPVIIHFQLQMFIQPEFLLHFNETYQAVVSPSSPIFYYVPFPPDVEVALIRLTSNDHQCMTLMIQNASCSGQRDVDREIRDSIGSYQTVDQKAGITFTKREFPNGIFVVLMLNPTDDACLDVLNSASPVRDGLTQSTDLALWLSRTKSVTFQVERRMSPEEYFSATFGVIFLFLSFYGLAALVPASMFFKSYWSRRRKASPLLLAHPDPDVDLDVETVVVVQDRELRTPPLTSRSSETVPASAVPDENSILVDNTFHDGSTDSDTDDADLLEDEDSEMNCEIIRNGHHKLFLCDLARKNDRLLAKKSSLYHWNLITVAIFYGLPVIQLVLAYQKVTNTTGNLDMCYYNFLCANPLGRMSDFNHVFSNLGYVLLGFLFIVIAYVRDLLHRRRTADDERGIPQHFGMYYAMGLALVMEGIMSACYHICPNHTNFQFDSAFMYTISILILLKIYQTRHPDVNANAYTAFLALAFIILVNTVGVLQGNIYFWVLFCIIHIVSCLLLSANVYYIRIRLNWGIFRRMMAACRRLKPALQGDWQVLKPLHPDRMVLLLVMNLVNWALSGYGVTVLAVKGGDFASFLLAVFIFNVMLYTLFYIIMKLRHREKVGLQTTFYILVSFTTWCGAMYFFYHKSITWTLSPAQSRNYNSDCKMLSFYDNHDIWHFLSATSLFLSFMVLLTLDDDLTDVPRYRIAVF